MATRKTTTPSAPAPAKRTKSAPSAASPVRASAAADAPRVDQAARPVKTAKAKPATVQPPAPTATAPAIAGTASAMPRPAAKDGATAVVTPEQRRHYIEVAAFYIAERRGFAPGDPLADWLAAQAEIDRAIASGHLGRG